jgi:hypothetical protein
MQVLHNIFFVVSPSILRELILLTVDDQHLLLEWDFFGYSYVV